LVEKKIVRGYKAILLILFTALLKIISYVIPLVNRQKKKLLIIRLDAIGDYVIFRNFLKELKESEKYKNYEITLLGNVIWKELSEYLDESYVDNFVWIDINSFYDRFPIKIFKKLNFQYFETIIVPNFARYWLSEEIASFFPSKIKILAYGNNERVGRIHVFLTKFIFNNIIFFPENLKIEFDKNIFFFKKILNREIVFKEPFIEIDNNIEIYSIKMPFILIFPGASDLKRVWPPRNFITLINSILKKTDLNIYISGSGGDFQVCDQILNEFANNDRIISIVNKFGLPKMLQFISKAKLVIANESAAIHLASALKVPSVCLLGGGHFGRFVSICENETSNSVIPNTCYHEMKCFHCNWICHYNILKGDYYPCLKEIESDKVERKVMSLLMIE
jgi:ADP-heptose:LPS heptosyltransferase